MNSNKFRKSFLFIYFCGLLLAPLVLVILPANFFDTGQSICLSVLLLNKTCLGCGMTRAFQHIIHLDFQAAFAFNKLSVIVFPVFLLLWLRELKRAFIKTKN